MKRKSILFFIPAIVLSIATSCSSGFKTLEKIVDSGKLIVATNAEFAPFEYVEGTSFKGIDIDIIEGYAEYIGVECDIQDQDFDAALLSVAKHKANVAIAAITKNEKREETMSFSNAYFTANQVVVVRSNSTYASLTTEATILAALSQNQARIGVQRGTTGQYYVEGDEDWGFDGIASTTCVAYDNGALAANALSNGQIDAVIIDIAPAEIYCDNFNNIQVLDVVLTQEEYAIAVGKGNDTLIASLNAYIALIKSNGVFDTIVSTYYGEVA